MAPGTVELTDVHLGERQRNEDLCAQPLVVAGVGKSTLKQVDGIAGTAVEQAPDSEQIERFGALWCGGTALDDLLQHGPGFGGIAGIEVGSRGLNAALRGIA